MSSVDRVPTPAAVLAVQDLSISFGSLRAVDGMHLDVYPGEIVGLIGPNGAGKSTLVNGISGTVKSQSGSVRLGDTELRSLRPHLRFRAGLGRTFQQGTLADNLTVKRTLDLAVGRGHYLRRIDRQGVEESEAIAAAVGLNVRRDQQVGSLTFMHRRLLSVVCALVGDTRVALLDEATAGLSSEERQNIIHALKQVVRENPDRALVVIEHDLEFVRAVTSRSVAMVAGRWVCEGPTDEVLANPTLVEAYIGTDE